MSNQHILIIGQEPSVIENLTNKLNEIGYHAMGSPAESIASRDLGHHFDLITFAGPVKAETRQRLESTFRKTNPGVISVVGLHPSVPLLVDQVKLALNRALFVEKPVSYINYDINEGCLSVFLKASYYCNIDISLYTSRFFSGTSKEQIYSNRAEPGENILHFRESVLSGFGSKFMVIQVNGQVHYIRRL